MSSLAKNIMSKVLKEASVNLPLPVWICLVIQFFANLEIISIIILDYLHITFSEKGYVSREANQIFSYIDPFILINPFDSAKRFYVFLTLNCMYFVGFFTLVIYLTCKASKQCIVNKRVSQAFTFVSFFHSRVLFYLLHYFFVKLINLSLKCLLESTETSCGAEWIVIASILTAMNLLIAFMKELFCFQIHKTSNPSGLKDNLHPLILLLHQSTLLPVIYFGDNTEITIGILNILFTGSNLYILQTRLPFYNIKVLKLSIVCSTIAFILSIVVMMKTLIVSLDILILLLFGIPLGVKLSLIRLSNTLLKIFKLKERSPIKIIHLPIILKKWLKDVSTFPIHKRFNRGAIYVWSFINKQYIDGIKIKEGAEAIKQVKRELYSLVEQKFTEVFNAYPENKLLLLSLAQIYIKKLENPPKAIILLNRINASAESISLQNSVNYIYEQIGSMYFKVANSEDANYANYFKHREKIIWLKDKIKSEISVHRKLWKTLNQDIFQIQEVIDQAEKINKTSTSIERYWTLNFQGLERNNINAPIIYGVYLDIIQGLPFAGIPLVRSAYQGLLNRTQSQDCIMNISAGNAAMIVASVEFDRAGEIIEASASVKALFGIEKENMIGSNINSILPNVIASEHKKLIQGFYRNFKYDINRKINSYAKTVNDEYFPVEVSLRLYPHLQQGLNMISYIKKFSKHEEMIITDYEGKIMECSRSLQSFVGFSGQNRYNTLAKFCPDLVLVNQAFNIKYEMKENMMETFDASQDKLDNQTTIKDDKPKIKENMHNLSRISLHSQHNILKSLRESEETTKFYYMLSEKTLGHGGDNHLQNSLRSKIDSAILSKEEAEEICDTFKKGKKLEYFNSRNTQKLTFETRIEPYFLLGTVYKIIKLKNVENNLTKIQSLDPESPDRFSRRQQFSDCFANEFPIAKEKIEDNDNDENLDGVKIIKKSFRIPTKVKFRPLTASKFKSENSSNLKGSKETDEKLNELQNIGNRIPRQAITSSIGSSKSGIDQAKYLNGLLKNTTIGYSTKISVYMVYLAIIAIIIAVIIDLIFTRKSLDKMQDSVDLIELVNVRSFRNIIAWQGVIMVYARALGLIRSADLIPEYQEVVRSSSLSMLRNNILLEQRLDEFADDDITKKLFGKAISLWVPYTNTTVNRDKVNSFSATHIIYENNIFVANFQGRINRLRNVTQAIFTINNTVNDYLLSVEESIKNVEDFFASVKENNIILSKMIVLVEILVSLSPFFSLLALFKIIIDSHKKLFKVVSKIQTACITERINQLNNIERHFKENTEELLAVYQDHMSNSRNSKSSVKSQNLGQNEGQKSSYQTKHYLLKGLVLNMLKHLVIAFCLIVFLMILFLVDFSTCLKSFDTLDEINQSSLTTFKLGEEIAMILPTFTFVVMFQNQPKFSIRNNVPSQELLKFVSSLNNANNILVSNLLTTRDGIEDTYIQNILKENVCELVSDDLKDECISITNENAYGLLGLNSQYYRTFSFYVEDYLKNATFFKGQQIFRLSVTQIRQIPTILNSAYETIGKHLLINFREQVAEKKEGRLSKFYINLTSILISMFIIRTLIIKRYKALYVSTKKILRVIPYSIIEKNKIFSFYLAKEFNKEFTDLR